MRFMMLMIPAVYQGGVKLDEGFAPPPAEMVAKMMKYNEDLAKAGALVSLDGLQPLAEGARVSYSKCTPTVTDGLFAETKEVLGGNWIINVASKEEAVDWARRVPAQDGDVVKLRQIFEMSDFQVDVQKAAGHAG